MDVQTELTKLGAFDEVLKAIKKEFAAQGVSNVGDSDDFFDNGGTSLGAMELIVALESQFGEGCVSPDQLFENSTPKAIAELIVSKRSDI